VRASVTQFRPRVGSFDKAVAAFRAASLQTCLSELTGIESNDAAALRARTFLRLGNPQAAALAVRRDDAPGFRARAEAALLRAVAHSRLGAADVAIEGFLCARVYAISAADTVLEAEVEFYCGLHAFGDGAVENVRAFCLLGLQAIALPVAPVVAPRVVAAAHVKSRIQELLGLSDAAEGRYKDQLLHARAALATLDDCPVPEVYQAAFAVANLAILVRDFDLEADYEAIAARVGALAWTDDISRVKFRTVEALAWSSALRGDPVGALRLLRLAAGSASTVPEEIAVAVDRAVFARELGHRAMAAEELEYALKLSRECRWDATADDQRETLLYLAEAVSFLSAAHGREVLERYANIGTAMSAAVASRLEARVRAEEAYAHGVVLRAEGRLAASVERLSAAFATWDRIGYEWRAGRAALELTELDAGEVFRLAVHRELRRRPQSLFSERARLVA